MTKLIVAFRSTGNKLTRTIICLDILQTSAAVYMRSVPYWEFKQRRMTVYCRRFGRTYQFVFRMSSSPRMTLEVVPVCCPET